MTAARRRLMIVLLVTLMVLSFYGIFNSGRPRSLFRLVLPDPSWDVPLTSIVSAGVLLTALRITGGRRDSRLTQMLRANEEHIRKLRRKGQSDQEIAESFLQALGSRSGILHRLARRRVLRHLSRLT